MRTPHGHPFATFAILVASLLPGAAGAVTLPPGFVDETLPFVFDVPTKLAFLPDGRLLVAEKGGIVYVVSGGTRHPIWVREEEVLNADDHGLLGIAVDPAFATNRRLYFLYTCDPDSNGVELDHAGEAWGRLTRYEMSATDPNAVDMGTRAVLAGAGWADGWPAGSGTHHVDDLAWGRDGSLLVSCGDGAHFETVDAGGLDPELFEPGRVDPAQDIGAFRAQMLDSPNGKVLRIDPASGLGYPSNPFFDGNPASVRSRVWSYGHRNPFRITVRPGTGSTDPAAGAPGTIYVGDVGWLEWEEVNAVREGGMNFGWPCRDGLTFNSDYQNAEPSHGGCETVGQSQDNPAQPTPPIAAFHHMVPGASLPAGSTAGVLAGGVFYTGANYPAEWRGLYFFGDYGYGWIRAMRTDAQDGVLEVRAFADEADGPVAFATDPTTGDLWYASVWTGEVHHIRFAASLAVEPRAATTTARLSLPMPNPASRQVMLSLLMPEAGEVRFEVLDVGGRRVWDGGSPGFTAGTHALSWNLRDEAGARAKPGVYFARVTLAGGTVLTRRIAVMR